ncbi:TetR/AcrR family transcriptional regulator [Gordonia desulfuricans]|uniref:TetR/AcrR family transcriptional regulator n=1 Tax=Gordonia desulfuricans TaxID=89051 RepID=A0A7K3LMU3_9ACTN|nr:MULTISPECIES: TetR/AcrR family transcriptional regulator [Gordonia]NDK89575.1 TetR/AcrR family transcriptional regulator [Gordonia desulfuricans]WLP92595.1 TetR/AcrR family transcriptional regulator [Gordonia sp. NB41Y]
MAPQPTKLTTAVIVNTAIDVADGDGLDAVSMRRLAEEIGVGAMSLYRHVDDKDALLQAMVTEVGRRFPYPVGDPVPAGWRERVAIAADIDWALYQRHPWVLLAYSVPRYGFGAEALDGMNWLAEGFLELGVDAVRAVDMVLTVWSYINGVALAAVSDRLMRSGPAGDDPGGLADIVSGRITTGLENLPHLAAIVGDPAAARLLDPRAALDAGVAYLCAGFEAATADGR